MAFIIIEILLHWYVAWCLDVCLYVWILASVVVCSIRMGAQLLSENRQNHMRYHWSVGRGIQIHWVFMCCSAIYSTMWQTTIQADLRWMHAMHAVIRCLWFENVVARVIAQQPNVSEKASNLVHFAITMAAVNVRIVQSPYIFKQNFIVARFNLY